MKTIVYCSDCKKDVLQEDQIANILCSTCGSTKITPNTKEEPHYIKAEKNRILKAVLLANSKDCIKFTTAETAVIMSQTDHRIVHSVDYVKIYCDCESWLHGNSEEYVEMFNHPFYCKHLFGSVFLHNAIRSDKITIPIHKSNRKYITEITTSC